MLHCLIEEAAAIACMALFLAMMAIWARIIATLAEVPQAWG
jgi:hypothetical protein